MGSHSFILNKTHIRTIKSQKAYVTNSGDSRMKKVGGALRGQGKK